MAQEQVGSENNYDKGYVLPLYRLSPQYASTSLSVNDEEFKGKGWSE
jgi:hypothetical protein